MPDVHPMQSIATFARVHERNTRNGPCSCLFGSEEEKEAMGMKRCTCSFVFRLEKFVELSTVLSLLWIFNAKVDTDEL